MPEMIARDAQGRVTFRVLRTPSPLVFDGVLDEHVFEQTLGNLESVAHDLTGVRAHFGAEKVDNDALVSGSDEARATHTIAQRWRTQ